ncbi:hypothetical protein DMJ13_06480 [halophilic archaeon]|nr:hypothetical protein DMJ13_06480 [halophilic archaeon]
MAEGGRGNESPREESLSTDEILEILSNYQRRGVIKHLRDAPGQVHSIDEIINYIKELEQKRYGESPGEDHLLSVLVHVHGPKLEDGGLVDYDIPNREIHYYPNAKVERLLTKIEATVEEFEEE